MPEPYRLWQSSAMHAQAPVQPHRRSGKDVTAYKAGSQNSAGLRSFRSSWASLERAQRLLRSTGRQPCSMKPYHCILARPPPSPAPAPHAAPEGRAGLHAKAGVPFLMLAGGNCKHTLTAFLSQPLGCNVVGVQLNKYSRLNSHVRALLERSRH